MAALKAKNYFFEWDVESTSNPGADPYQVRIRLDGTLSCKCPRWIFKKKDDQWRSCPHVRGVGQDDFTKGTIIQDRLLSHRAGSPAAIAWDLYQRGLPLEALDDVAAPGSSVPVGSLTTASQSSRGKKVSRSLLEVAGGIPTVAKMAEKAARIAPQQEAKIAAALDAPVGPRLRRLVTID